MSMHAFVRAAKSSLIRVSFGAGLIALLTSALLTAPASAATPAGSASAQPARYCVMVVGKAASPDGVSPVQYEFCSTKSREDARASLNSPTAQAKLGPTAVTSSDLLMTWFKDANYGSPLTDIYGSAGTCDSAGYRIKPNPYWQANLSSAAGFGQCNRGKFTTRSLTFAATYVLPIYYVGQTLNDNVGLVNVYNR